MKKALLFLLLIIPGFNHAVAQTAQDEAMALYNIAETDYENKDFLKCDQALLECLAKLNQSTNVKIEYLRIKNIYDGVAAGSLNANYHNYKLMHNRIAVFFSLVDRNTYPVEKYQQIVQIKVAIADKLNDYTIRKIYYRSLKAREPKFLIDTVDVYMNRFVKAYNDDWDNLSHHCRNSWKELFNGKLYYDPQERKLSYDFYKGKSSNIPGYPFHGYFYELQVQRVEANGNYWVIGGIAIGSIQFQGNSNNSNCTVISSKYILEEFLQLMKSSGMSKLYDGSLKDVVQE